jgi:hypothetical protein
MSLDISKLQNVKQKEGKATARCPACAEKNGDKKGEHLVMYPEGAYACVAHPDRVHSSRIYELVGMPETKVRWGPIPVRIRRPDRAERPRVLLTVPFESPALRKRRLDEWNESIQEFLALLPLCDAIYDREWALESSGGCEGPDTKPSSGDDEVWDG